MNDKLRQAIERARSGEHEALKDLATELTRAGYSQEAMRRDRRELDARIADADSTIRERWEMMTPPGRYVLTPEVDIDFHVPSVVVTAHLTGRPDRDAPLQSVRDRMQVHLLRDQSNPSGFRLDGHLRSGMHLAGHEVAANLLAGHIDWDTPLSVAVERDIMRQHRYASERLGRALGHQLDRPRRVARAIIDQGRTRDD